MTDWKRISDSTVQEFIFKNEYTDERELVLNHKTLFDLPAKDIAEQIAGRRKAKKKLPLWFETQGIVYPPSLNLEQSSSQATARFKAAYLKAECEQNNLVDLTGGFGVDAYYFSRTFDTVTYVEPNAALLARVIHNHTRLQAGTIQHVHATAESYIDRVQNKTVFYLDPSRRDEQKKKIFKLSDCEPDITQLQKVLFDKGDFVLLKASPLLDIRQGLREMAHVKTVTALSVESEMKELLFFLQKNFDQSPTLLAIDLSNAGDIKSRFSFLYEEELAAIPKLEEPLQYLYEPNAAIMKAGAFKLVAEKFNLYKLAQHTHLYTSVTRVNNFPGRTFQIEQVNPTDKTLQEWLPDNRAHVAVRNYPLTAQQLMKKRKLQEGGDRFLWGFSTAKKKYVALCKRVS